MAASSLSLLGVLGLIKSSIKLALGLKLCASAGFNLESIRGVFGYLPGESAMAGDLCECFIASVTVFPEKITIHKTQHYFSGANTPIVDAAVPPKPKPFSTIINLGNDKGESSSCQSILWIISAVVICSGCTSWLLLIITADWTWVKIFAIPILHICLVLMLALPLWYGRQINRPGKHLTTAKWEALCGKSVKKPTVLNLLQVCKNESRDGEYQETLDILHFRGDTSLIHSKILKIGVLLLSAIAATAYICQYSILKVASSKEALIWLGCQGGLAAVRILYWIVDPSFDDPVIADTGYAIINNLRLDHVMLMEIICAAASDTTIEIPWWAWDYLSTKPLQDIIQSAVDRKVGSSIPLDAKYYVFLDVDFMRILRRRGIEKDYNADYDFRLGLYRLPNATSGELVLILSSPLQISREFDFIYPSEPCLRGTRWRNDLPPIGTNYKYWVESTDLTVENSDDPAVFYRESRTDAETLFCALFVVDNFGERVCLCRHPASERAASKYPASKHSLNCPWIGKVIEELHDSRGFDNGFNTRYQIYIEQSKVCSWLGRISREIVLRGKRGNGKIDKKVDEGSVVIVCNNYCTVLDLAILQALEKLQWYFCWRDICVLGVPYRGTLFWSDVASMPTCNAQVEGQDPHALLAKLSV